jgi:hypothetical protein
MARIMRRAEERKGSSNDLWRNICFAIVLYHIPWGLRDHNCRETSSTPYEPLEGDLGTQELGSRELEANPRHSSNILKRARVVAKP